MIKNIPFFLCIIFSLICSSQKSVETISGILEFGNDNRVVIMVNSESRSRISYYVNGDLSKELEGFIGQKITVVGSVLQDFNSPWKREITVIEYTIETEIKNDSIWSRLWKWLS